MRAYLRSKSPEAAAEVYRLMTTSESEKIRLAAALGILKGAGALDPREDDGDGRTITLPPANGPSPNSLPTSALLELKRQRSRLTTTAPSSTPSPTRSGEEES